MTTIFLSHSSFDKQYVSYIADTLGKDRCIYDEMCFEEGMRTLEMIFEGIDRSSLFVFFISDNSLKSEWVQREICYAEEKLHHDSSKLSRIFPIIIDSTITHKDDRIPDFLKKGFGAYNLRYIENNKIACRKILAQQRRLQLESDLQYKKTRKLFYGRNDERTNLQRTFDTSDGITCLVASGIEGIGRKSYLIESLKNIQVIEEYYEPSVISLGQMDSIEDIIMKLSEVGFGKYTLESITTLNSMEEKIDILVDVLKKVQKYKEHVVIYDNGCLIGYEGELVYWFAKALTMIRREITISIAAKNRLHPTFLRRNAHLFSQELSVLPHDEQMGLMRQYSHIQGIDLSPEDRDYFSDIFTGYPPQIIFCVDLIKDKSLEYVKKNSYEIVEKFSQKASSLLDAAIPEPLKESANGFLTFLSLYGIVPTIILNDIIELNNDYKDLYRLFRSLTICRSLGSVQEYIEVNPVIGDYVQRNRYSLPEDITAYLKKKLNDFEEIISDPPAIEEEDYESLKYYLKRNIMDGREVPERCLYSTIYLSAIYELYNGQKYTQVINIVKKLKDGRVFSMYDENVQSRLQGYYCRALARENNSVFYTEVDYFREIDPIQYNFLRGFMERNRANYNAALTFYKKVLSDNPRHRSTRREIVIAYRGIEDYSSAYDYAEENYREEPENPYQIQPYFEILVRKQSAMRTPEEEQILSDMRKTLFRINAGKPLSIYYELEAEYAAFVEKNWERSYSFLIEGRNRFPDSSYIEKSVFDCAELFQNKAIMEDCLKRLEALSQDSSTIKLVYDIRCVKFDAMNKKSIDLVQNKINSIKGLNEDSKEHLFERIRKAYY